MLPADGQVLDPLQSGEHRRVYILRSYPTRTLRDLITRTTKMARQMTAEEWPNMTGRARLPRAGSDPGLRLRTQSAGQSARAKKPEQFGCVIAVEEDVERVVELQLPAVRHADEVIAIGHELSHHH